MSELDIKLFKMILKNLSFFLLGVLIFSTLISVVIAPITMVANITETISSFFKREGSIEKDYRIEVDEWQSITHTSFNYDELLMCMYVNENEDKIKLIKNCVSYFDGSGNFINPLIKIDGHEIFGIYKNEIL